MLILHPTVLGDATPCSLVKTTGASEGHAVTAPVTAAASLSATVARANNTKRHTSQLHYSSLCDKQ